MVQAASREGCHRGCSCNAGDRPRLQICLGRAPYPIAPRDRTRSERGRAENARQGQFEAYDMLLGRVEPELGGSEDVVDVVGLNF